MGSGAGRHGCLSPTNPGSTWFCLQSLISSLKKGPELLKWFPTCPRPQQRRPAQPPTRLAGGSPLAPRMPSSPCELGWGWLPDGRSPVSPPSRHRPLLLSPALLSPALLSPWKCHCLLPGLPLVRTASLGRWDSCSQRPLTAPRLSHHRFPHRFPPGGPGGRAQPRASQRPWDWLLSRHWGCLSSSRFHHSAVSLGQGARTAHILLAWGEPRLWGGQLRPLDSGHQHLVSSCGIALCCSPTVCFPHTVPIWGGGTGSVLLLAWASLWV